MCIASTIYFVAAIVCGYMCVHFETSFPKAPFGGGWSDWEALRVNGPKQYHSKIFGRFVVLTVG